MLIITNTAESIIQQNYEKLFLDGGTSSKLNIVLIKFERKPFLDQRTIWFISESEFFCTTDTLIGLFMFSLRLNNVSKRIKLCVIAMNKFWESCFYDSFRLDRSDWKFWNSFLILIETRTKFNKIRSAIEWSKRIARDLISSLWIWIVKREEEILFILDIRSSREKRNRMFLIEKKKEIISPSQLVEQCLIRKSVHSRTFRQ